MALLSQFYLGVAAVLLMVVHLVRCLSSPLRKVPGPTVSLFTTLVLKWKELNAGRTMYVHELHQKYGPVVRVSPNEVSFTSWHALKEIYCSGGSGYDKSDFYNLFRIYGRRTMFTTLNKADVSVCRPNEIGASLTRSSTPSARGSLPTDMPTPMSCGACPCRVSRSAPARLCAVARRRRARRRRRSL